MSKLKEYLKDNYPSKYVGGDVRVRLILDRKFVYPTITKTGVEDRLITYPSGKDMFVVEWDDKKGVLIRDPDLFERNFVPFDFIESFLIKHHERNT